MIRHLVLLGLGPGHLWLVQALAKKRPADVAITLISRQERYVDDTDVLRAVAGRCTDAAQSGLLLAPLLRDATVRQLHHHVQALDPEAKMLLLDDGRELRFDWLSLEPEPVQARDSIDLALPGARANGLFLRPRAAFCTLWPRVAELATQRALSVAVVCGDPQATGAAPWADEKFAIELAFAVRRGLAGSAVTLITGGPPVASGRGEALQRCLVQAFKQRRITVLMDAARALHSGEVALHSGARLSCDVALLAVCSTAPAWLAGSGLGLAGGQIAVDAANRSTSHPHVFAHPGRSNAAHPTANPTSASARQLVRSLCAVMDNQAPQPGRPASTPGSWAPSQWIDTAHGPALVQWHRWAWSSWAAGIVLRWFRMA